MRTLILGGSTFVGRRLVGLLDELGHEVAVLNRGKTPSDLPEGVTRLIGDRTDVESLRSALSGREFDAVFDVSGFVMVAGGGDYAALLDLLDGSVGAYVFVSSIMAYEPSGLMPWTEDMPTTTDPPTTYGGFKAFAEQTLIDRHARHGFPASIARPAAIYGPDNNIHDMETAMFTRLRQGRPILLPHGGLVTTSYGHVDDLCTNLMEMAANSDCHGQIVNTTGSAASALAYTETLAHIVGAQPDIRFLPDDVDLPSPIFGHLFSAKHHGILSRAKARSLGLSEARDFTDGHAQTYAWFCSSERSQAPSALADPIWGAGYDLELEASIAATLPR
jgi:nucleoside-diphosphate-sugar epimerase